MDIKRLTFPVDPAAFLQGLAAVALIWAGMIVYAMSQSGAVKEEMQTKLAVRTVMIENAKPAIVAPPPPANPEPQKQSEVTTEKLPTAVPSPDTPPDIDVPVVLEGLRASPIDGLVENTPQGPLPKKRDYDGLTPFNAYKRPYDFADDTPLVALLVQDFGLSQSLSREAAEKLPPEISFLVSPYSDDIQGAVTAARNRGHETWLETPMESRRIESADPGPGVIMSRSSLSDNEAVLKNLMTRFHGYPGIAGYVDDSFNNYAATMMDALVGLNLERGIGYIDLNPDAPPLMPRLAFNYNAPYARVDYQARDVAALTQLEQKARDNRFALGTIKLTPYNLKIVSDWAASLKDKNITLIPASAIADAPTRLMGRTGTPQDATTEAEAAPSEEAHEAETTPAEETPAPEHTKEEAHH